MPLRDDHEAALVRADALQTELDRERADDAAQTARIERLETELADARAKLASIEKARARDARGQLAPPDQPRARDAKSEGRRSGTASADDRPQSDPLVFVLFVLGIGLFVLVLLGFRCAAS
jgi:hypothetical protein